MKFFVLKSLTSMATGLSLLFLLACNATKPCVEKIDPACVCPMDYNPVCGCNGKTYGNACMAECSGIKTYTKGECPDKKNAVKLEGVSWQLTTLAVGPQPQTIPADVNIFFKLEKGRMEGKGGCNNIGSEYTLNGTQLSFSPIISTKMFCEKSMYWETEFLKMLEFARSYSIQGEILDINCGDMGNLVFRKGR